MSFLTLRLKAWRDSIGPSKMEQRETRVKRTGTCWCNSSKSRRGTHGDSVRFKSKLKLLHYFSLHAQLSTPLTTLPAFFLIFLCAPPTVYSTGQPLKLNLNQSLWSVIRPLTSKLATSLSHCHTFRYNRFILPLTDTRTCTHIHTHAHT